MTHRIFIVPVTVIMDINVEAVDAETAEAYVRTLVKTKTGEIVSAMSNSDNQVVIKSGEAIRDRELECGWSPMGSNP